jgi:hypothetical protein
MPVYLFKASDGARTFEDVVGSPFDDDEMAVFKILGTVRHELGPGPIDLIVMDEQGRVVAQLDRQAGRGG